MNCGEVLWWVLSAYRLTFLFYYPTVDSLFGKRNAVSDSVLASQYTWPKYPGHGSLEPLQSHMLITLVARCANTAAVLTEHPTPMNPNRLSTVAPLLPFFSAIVAIAPNIHVAQHQELFGGAG